MIKENVIRVFVTLSFHTPSPAVPVDPLYQIKYFSSPSPPPASSFLGDRNIFFWGGKEINNSKMSACFRVVELSLCAQHREGGNKIPRRGL